MQYLKGKEKHNIACSLLYLLVLLYYSLTSYSKNPLPSPEYPPIIQPPLQKQNFLTVSSKSLKNCYPLKYYILG